MYAGFTRAALGAALCASAACGGEAANQGAPSGGALLIVTGGDADAVLPPLVKTSVGKQVVDAIFLPIARPGDVLVLVGDAGYTPALAERWEWAADSLTIAFHLDPRARWHDGIPVRAADVRYSLAAYRAPGVASSSAPSLASIDSISVRDSLTFVAWYGRRSPTQFYDLVYNLTPIPQHVYGAIPFDSLGTSVAVRSPVGSGKFRFARWTPGERVEVLADTAHWLGRPRLDRVAWIVVGDATAQVTKLVTGEADMIEALRGPALATAAADTSIRLVSAPSFAYAMAAFNLRHPADPRRPHPLFGDRGVRRALTMAIDRREVVSSILDTLGVTMTSPYVTELRIAGADLLPYDPAHATALLDSLGWRDSDDDGVRQKGGRDLAFSLTAPVSSTTRVRATEILQQSFKAVGARVTLDHVASPVQMTAADAGTFDVTVLGFSGDPSPSALRQYWKSERAGQGSNFGGYSSRAFDAVIDSAAANLNPGAAVAQFGRAGHVLAEDAPAIWIYELKTVSGIHKRFRPAAMPAWAWWAHLDEWSVDPAHMRDRDRLGAARP